MGQAQNYWCNIQEIVDLNYTLHAGAKVKKDKGKPIICSVLGAVVSAAVEHKHQQKADTEIITLSQDLVKVLQLQLEEDKANIYILQEEIRNQNAITGAQRGAACGISK